MEMNKRNNFTRIAIGSVAIIALVLLLGTVWVGRSAKEGTETAVHSVSLLYLEELAGRREQVVEDNLNNNINVIKTAVSLMTEEDLKDAEHLQAYQARMKRLFRLEKFAFVDRNGLIYTSTGLQAIDGYDLDVSALKEPRIFILNLDSADKKAIIAVPITPLAFGGWELTVCFMEISMGEIMSGVSIGEQNAGTTFCNLYTRGGIPLNGLVLGGLAQEDNLLDALSKAEFSAGYSYEQAASDITEGRGREVSFSYGGIQATLDYVPVAGTDWLLTFLLQESVISDKISFVTDGIILRSAILAALTVIVLLFIFSFIIAQNRRNAKTVQEMETAQAEAKDKQGGSTKGSPCKSSWRNRARRSATRWRGRKRPTRPKPCSFPT